MSTIDYAALQERTLRVCHQEGWARGWTAAGCCLHLEASEFIEACRGKQGDPVEEAGDVLFVLLSMAADYGIGIDEIAIGLISKMNRKGQAV